MFLSMRVNLNNSNDKRCIGNKWVTKVVLHPPAAPLSLACLYAARKSHPGRLDQRPRLVVCASPVFGLAICGLFSVLARKGFHYMAEAVDCKKWRCVRNWMLAGRAAIYTRVLMRYGSFSGKLKLRLYSDARPTERMSAHDSGLISQLLNIHWAKYSRNRVVHESETNFAICELLQRS